MTTATAPAIAPAPAFERIARVVKLNLVNPWNTIVMPWLILGAIFVLNYGISLIIFANLDAADRADAGDGMQYSGASSWIFVYLMVVAIQAMNFTFPLALGYGSTRRAFYLGSSLTFVLLSVMWAAGLTLVSWLESVTNGWGIGSRMFTAIYFGGDDTPIWQRSIIFLCVALFFFFVGAAIASVYVRWRVLGMVVFFFLLGLLLVGAIALVTFTGNWDAVGSFFVTNGATGVALWLLVPTAIAGLAGYLVLRRATPRS